MARRRGGPAYARQEQQRVFAVGRPDACIGGGDVRPRSARRGSHRHGPRWRRGRGAPGRLRRLDPGSGRRQLRGVGDAARGARGRARQCRPAARQDRPANRCSDRGAGLVQISDSSSRILAGLLEARTGQQLTISRRWRIETALSALMRERGISTIDELITILVMGKEPSLSQNVVEALLNNETYFFRDRSPFDLLQRYALPELAKLRQKSKRLRIWSAGCSTGQEVYSLAMLFVEDAEQWRGWTVDIL